MTLSVRNAAIWLTLSPWPRSGASAFGASAAASVNSRTATNSQRRHVMYDVESVVGASAMAAARPAPPASIATQPAVTGMAGRRCSGGRSRCPAPATGGASLIAQRHDDVVQPVVAPQTARRRTGGGAGPQGVVGRVGGVVGPAVGGRRASATAARSPARPARGRGAAGPVATQRRPRGVCPSPSRLASAGATRPVRPIRHGVDTPSAVSVSAAVSTRQDHR